MSDTPLRKARKRANLTQEDLAKELGVSGAQVSRIEQRGTDSLTHALKLTELLDIDLKDVAPREGSAQ